MDVNVLQLPTVLQIIVLLQDYVSPLQIFLEVIALIVPTVYQEYVNHQLANLLATHKELECT